MQIYCLENKVNGKCYVGKTVSDNLHDYLSVKRWAVKHGKHLGMPVIRAISKYGWDNFETKVLATAETEEELNNLERLWIILLNTRAAGYNVTAGGDVSRTGMKNSPEHNARIGAANKGRKPAGYIRTEEHRQQLRDRMRGNELGHLTWTNRKGKLLKGKPLASSR
jgi:group I intron endonuclease